MMSWTPTPTRTAVDTLVHLWRQPDWRSSAFADEIRSALSARLDDSDDVNRLQVAQIAHLLVSDDEAGFNLVRDRLVKESHPLVAATLVSELYNYIDERASDVDSLLEILAAHEPWTTLLNEVETTTEQTEPLNIFTGIALNLAIRYRTSTATNLIQNWLTECVTTAAAWQTLTHLRGWIELPAEQSDERAHAFTLLETAIESLTSLRQSADSDLQGRAYLAADLVAGEVRFASDSQAKVRVDETFAVEAFSALGGISQFKHPSITHSIIEALGNLAPADPVKAFHIVAAAISTGDDYTYDQVAASETVAFIERYFAEFRSSVIADDELLTAIRSVLHAFVDAGWPAAITLAYQLSEAFR